MTLDDWQALDARIAREIMLFVKWDDLSEDALKIYWETMDERPTKVFLSHNRKYWWFLNESGCPDSTESLRSWQPHLKVAQAILALRTLLVKVGPHATAKIAMRPSASLYRTTIQNWVSTGGVPAMLVRSPHVDNEMHAICLAIEACLNAQGMPDWASG